MVTVRDAIDYMNSIGACQGDKYTTDKGWRIPVRSGIGDCEDYGFGVMWLVGGKSRWGMLKVIWSRKITMHWTILGDKSKHWMFRETATGLWWDQNWRGLYDLRAIRKAWPSADIDETPQSRPLLTLRLIPALIRGPV